MEPRIAILTVSDTRTGSQDLSGPAVANALKEFGFHDFTLCIVKDGMESVSEAILDLAQSHQVVVTTGGTGFSPRDLTPDATAAILERRADTVCELMRLKGLEQTPFAHLSRGIAGIIGQTFVLNLPGSPKAAAFGIQAIGHLLQPIINSLTQGECSAEPHKTTG